MINVKDIVYKGLSQVVENVSDAYPQNWSKTPAIQFVEEENKPYEFTDDKEQLSFVRFRIDIWDMKSTMIPIPAMRWALRSLAFTVCWSPSPVF